MRQIDVLHRGREKVIACFEVDGILVDPGPQSCEETLLAGLAGVRPEALLLTHIHFDHAGAAGALVRRWPNLPVYVHERGAPHMADPERLVASAVRLYGGEEGLRETWGEVIPVPEENLHVLSGGETVLGFKVAYTPGHASHHVCYLHSDGTLYAGDAVGVRIVPTRLVLPASPPPDIDVEGWFRTFEEIERRRPERLAMTHFGVADSPSEHLALAREELSRWSEWAEQGLDEGEWIEAARGRLRDIAPDEADTWERAAPLWQSYAGLERYWRKRREREAGA